MLPEVSTLLSAAEAEEPKNIRVQMHYYHVDMTLYSITISHRLSSQVQLKLVKQNSQFTSEGVCPGLLMPGWNWGLLIGAVRRGVGLVRTTVVGVGEVEDTGPEAG